mgnify:CR=1 FL=1
MLIILAFFGGMVAGMFLLRRQFEKEFASNPRLNVEAVRTLLGASGQRPSEAKVQQVYRQIVSPTKISNGEKQEKIKSGGNLTIINERGLEEFLSPSFWKEEIWITDRLVF